MQTRIRNTRPTVVIQTGPLAGLDISNLLLTAHTEKDLSQPAGIFTITLGMTGINAPKTAFAGQLSTIYKDLGPNHLISIGFTSQCCMLGMVDAVTRSHSTSGASTAHTLTITGRDFGKALLTDTAYVLLSKIDGLEDEFPEGHAVFNLFRAIGKPLEYTTNDGEKRDLFFNQSPIEAIEWIVANTPGLQILQDGSVGPVLHDWLILDTRTETDSGKIANAFEGDVLLQPDLTSFTGDIWSFIMSCVDEFYEVFIDSAIDPNSQTPSAYLRVRPKPFDRLGDQVNGSAVPDTWAWERSPTFMQRIGYRNSDTTGPEPLHQVNTRDGQFTAALTASDYETFAVFEVDDTNSFQSAIMEQAGFSELRSKWFVLLDAYLVKRFGFKVKTLSSQLVDKTNFDAQTQEKVDRLYNWHKYNFAFESGTFEVACNDNRRIGDRLYITDLISKGGNVGMEFYIKSVENHWDVDQTIVPRQTLGLIRGHNTDDLKAVDELLKPLRGKGGLGGD